MFWPANASRGLLNGGLRLRTRSVGLYFPTEVTYLVLAWPSSSKQTVP